MKTTKEDRERIRERYDDYEGEAELCDDFVTLEAELASAREALKEIGAYGNAAARLWLNDHPEPEAKGVKQ